MTIGAPIGTGIGSPTITIPDNRVTDIANTSIVTAVSRTGEGELIKANTLVWKQVVRDLGDDWSKALEMDSRQWEEMLAAAFDKTGWFDEVTLTPHKADKGRDVIGEKNSFGSLKMIGQMKRYKPGLNVTYDDVRAMIGVLSADLNASKAIIATTSNFPPNIEQDDFIMQFVPNRLELLDGEKLQAWFNELAVQDK